MITDSKADEYSDRFHIYTDEQINLDEDTYLINENGDIDENGDYCKLIIFPSYQIMTASPLRPSMRMSSGLCQR